MTPQGALSTVDATPPTNRGVYPHCNNWSPSRFDYIRATVPIDIGEFLSGLARGLAPPDFPLNIDDAPTVKHYDEHRVLKDRLGRDYADVFWGGQNGKPNVEAKGHRAVAAAALLRASWEHHPSRIDTKRDGKCPGLFAEIREIALRFRAERGITISEIQNHHPDKGDTVYLGSYKHSEKFFRIYQPGLKLAQEEHRTGDQIAQEERETVRVELVFKPEKGRAKRAAATLSPDEMWGISPWVADFASEVFAMDVQAVSVSTRRESNRNRALRFACSQYRAHFESLFQECNGDVALFGSILLDLAEIPHSNH